MATEAKSRNHQVDSDNEISLPCTSSADPTIQ